MAILPPPSYMGQEIRGVGRLIVLTLLTEIFPYLDHRQRVQRTVPAQLPLDLGFALGWAGLINRFLEGFHRHPTILDTSQLVVADARRNRRQHLLDAPASLLAGVVIAHLGDIEKIENPIVDGQ